MTFRGHVKGADCDLEAEQAVLGAFLIDGTPGLASERPSPRRPSTWSRTSRSRQPSSPEARRASPPTRCSSAGTLRTLAIWSRPDLVFPLAKGLGTAANVSYYWHAYSTFTSGAQPGLPTSSPPSPSAGRLRRRKRRSRDGDKRVATGWRLLDRALGGGFGLPSLNISGRQPKSGKSTWAQIIAERHVEAGGVVYYLDLENGRRRFMRRMLCRHAKLGGAQVAVALGAQRRG